jgi:Protein of unknown function (DUF3089)
MQRSCLLILLVVLCISFSCTPKYSKYIPRYPHTNARVPDYREYDYWAAHPQKNDPSDSVPHPLKTDYRYDSSVDVFFLHPTTFTQKEETSWNADLNDPSLNAKTDYSTILYQASVFNEYRVFAPRYRQAHLRSYYTAENSASIAFDTAYEDVKNAFKYYLEHYNNDRPLIIASHSQGTTHAKRLLKEFFENKPLADKLVAAYLVGMYIPTDYFTGLQTCKDSVQTGCICAWRSFQNNYIPSFVEKENGSGVVVNPLTWTTEETYASKIMNKGSVLRNFNKVYYHVADAKINKGILWINKPDFPGSFFIRMKNYHIADINFFYMNTRENVRQRVKAFKNKNH